jgi:hypothetical protein
MTTSSFASLSGPDFVRMDRRQIKALSLDELQFLALRSQRLLATALFKPAQNLFEVMPDEYVLHVLLEWLTIEDQARLDRALTNHKYRNSYLHLLRDTVHKGVLSVSGKTDGYTFNSGVGAWLESRYVFMHTLKFHDDQRDIPAGFLARTGQQLLHLDLDHCGNITDARLSELAGSCPRLENVNLSRCQSITDGAAASLAKHCPGLHSLSLSNTRIGDAGLALLGEDCRGMKQIGLRGLKIRDAGLAKFAELCPGLTDVDITYCRKITDKSAASLARHCPRLHTLELRDTQVTASGLARLGESCRELKKIGVDDVSDAGLRKITASCPKLEHVDLRACPSITDDGAASLAKHCSGLYTLDLSYTQITDAGLAILVESCRELKQIGLAKLAVSDAGLAKIAARCPKLENWDLSGCRNITDDGLASLAHHCPRLHTLVLSFTRVTDLGLARLAEGCGDMKKLGWRLGHFRRWAGHAREGLRNIGGCAYKWL